MSKPLTPQQRDVIAAMISNAKLFDGGEVDAARRNGWLEGVDKLSQGEPCPCGMCPSVQLLFDGRPTPESSPRTVLSAEGFNSVVLLFIDGDKPSYLEVAEYGEGGGGMPRAGQLEF